MKSGRLHAYEVLLRVAKVREIRAALALGEASAEEQLCRNRHDEILAARDLVTTASRTSAANGMELDMARYEMLANLDSALAARLHVASNALDSARSASQGCASANVAAKRYREHMDEHVDNARRTMDQKHSSIRQEEAIELWLGDR